ncbi:CxxC-x17-CxxC domain-containing protein [Thermanaeromonas toyohensis ToBE]|uniref:CxxC-x17-CxxC domain-containing protein n=1 Tax=Thermanaeromonas toyohensis ToBE TaxID=698762 RepID=A0A1W1W065_9FIRM|nr:zinc-ribbon domain containing protein [Thermanaeromonas toyohensis]SMB99007.1 CxxC-x17-CxxC domain-containing protein [Thermanaeromonas toyohensis ToBE]
MFKDKVLTCKDCGAEFVFTAGQQAFFLEKGFTNEPSRCPACRAAKKQQRGHNSRGAYPRKMYRATCSRCGAVTEVPFEPRGDRPVYCRACYQMRVESYR